MKPVLPAESLTPARRLARLGLGLLLVLQAGCSMVPHVKVPGMDRIVGDEGIFRDRKGEYLQAKTIPRTQIPAGMDDYIIDDLLVIPQVPGNNNEEDYPDPPRPMPLQERSDREVVIQRMDGQGWIVADASPSQVWPKIRDYWRQAGVNIVNEDPTDGIMDTGWFVQKDNKLTRDKFRVKVSTGFQNDTSEIRLLHVSAPQALPLSEQVKWPEKSADPKLENSFLTALSQYLADTADLYQASTVSFLAAAIPGTGKAKLVTTPSGNQMLKLEAGYNRSWAAIKRALTRKDLTVTGDNEDLGTIDIAFDPESLNKDGETNKPGLFKKVITLDGILTGGDQSQIYQIRLHMLPTKGTVEVLAEPTVDRSAPAQDAADSLLKLIRDTIA